jgi:leucine-rich repeat protein SHOC2
MGGSIVTEVEKIIELAKLNKAKELYLSGKNGLVDFPESILELSNLTGLFITNSELDSLPENISKLINLTYLSLRGNQFKELPKNIIEISNLSELDLSENPLTDLSILDSMPKLENVDFFGVSLPRRYWTKLSDWNPQWLLDEENAELRRALIQQVGYERACQVLNIDELDNWREYSLLRIDDIENFYDIEANEVIIEPMVLLKMTCPSTGHIHILRVPPEMTSAEAAITWINHGIHPDEFSVQT